MSLPCNRVTTRSTLHPICDDVVIGITGDMYHIARLGTRVRDDRIGDLLKTVDTHESADFYPATSIDQPRRVNVSLQVRSAACPPIDGARRWRDREHNCLVIACRIACNHPYPRLVATQVYGMQLCQLNSVQERRTFMTPSQY